MNNKHSLKLECTLHNIQFCMYVGIRTVCMHMNTHESHTHTLIVQLVSNYTACTGVYDVFITDLGTIFI